MRLDKVGRHDSMKVGRSRPGMAIGRVDAPAERLRASRRNIAVAANEFVERVIDGDSGGLPFFHDRRIAWVEILAAGEVREREQKRGSIRLPHQCPDLANCATVSLKVLAFQKL